MLKYKIAGPARSPSGAWGSGQRPTRSPSREPRPRQAHGDAEAPHQHAVLQYSAGGTLKKCLSELKTDALNSRAMAVALARAAASGGEVADKGLPGMEFPMAAVAMRQLASALAHLHGLDVCHRDVKPANILLSSVGTTGRGESGRAAGGGRSLTADSLHLRLTGCVTLASRACAGTRG